MNKKDVKRQVKNGVKTFGKGCGYVLGTMGVAALSIMAAGIEAEAEKKEGESYKGLMTAIVNSDIDGYFQKRIIEAIATKDLTTKQQDSIIAICESDMDTYLKYRTIMNIVD